MRTAAWWPNWRESPFTFVYLCLLAAGSLTLGALDAQTRSDVLHASSTDVTHLASRPIFVLVASGMWVDSVFEFVVAAVLIGVAASALERQIGTRATLGIFLSGHVGATLLTEGAVAVGVLAGALPSSALSRLDVGVSYGLAAIVAAAVGLLPHRARLAALALMWGGLGGALVADPDVTAWGHMLGAALGGVWWSALPRHALGIMVGWSKSTALRLPASSWLPRRRSTIRTSSGRSSSYSTTMRMARSASS
jgi:hypothetical protein